MREYTVGGCVTVLGFVDVEKEKKTQKKNLCNTSKAPWGSSFSAILKFFSVTHTWTGDSNLKTHTDTQSHTLTQSTHTSESDLRGGNASFLLACVC